MGEKEWEQQNESNRMGEIERKSEASSVQFSLD